MITPIETAIGGAILAAAPWGIVGLVKFLRRRVKITGPSLELLSILDAEVKCQRPIVSMLLSLQRPQLSALKAILEALKGDVNGNVATAHGLVEAAIADFDKFLVSAALPASVCKEDKE
jgi:hypothetical protein